MSKAIGNANVATQSRLLLGKFEDGVQVFRGVPYSVPPVGERRLRSPLSCASESEVVALPPYGNGTLPPGIRSHMATNINGLSMHVLEAGFDESGRPLVLLLHGFPDLCYCWRKIMAPLAAAGYHVIAPDQRGYGRTTGWDDAYDVDVGAFSLLTIARDACR